MNKIKKVIIILIFLFVLGINTPIYNKDKNITLQAESTFDERELKAVWVTPLTGDVSINGESFFKNNMTEVLDIMEYYGLNALIFHVRTHNNALYPSELNPKANYVSNINFDSFDPIQWLIKESHKRGIEFHAWMNPYRVGTSNQTGTLPESNPQSDPDNLIEGSSVILNPAKEVVKEHIYNTINEFIELYPTVDAIHFDDYFYIQTNADPVDSNSRRAHIDDLIEGIHDVLRDFNETKNTKIQFGISPTGIYKNGNGSVTYDENGNPITDGSNTGGQEHYESYLYADTFKWAINEWIDYLLPQVYWARNHTDASFTKVIDWWDKVFKNLNVNLYSGIGVHMADSNKDTYDWQIDMHEMDAQLLLINDKEHVQGYSIYSYKYLKNGYNNSDSNSGKQIRNAYQTEDRKAIKVLPEIRTMNAVIPNMVTNVVHTNGTLTWDAVDEAKFYYIYKANGELTYSSDEIIGVVGNGLTTFKTDDLTNNYNYGVRALSKTNHLGEITTEGPFEVIYDLGEYGYLSEEDKESLLWDFVGDYKELYGRTGSTQQELYDGFAVNSYIPHDIKDIFQPEYKNGKWAWILEYFLYLANETEYDELDKLEAWNQTTIRTNIQGFIQEIEFNFYNLNNDLVSTSLDFSTEDAINGFWRFTSYNQIIKTNEDPLLNGSTITSWKDGYGFVGWYLNPELMGEAVTEIPDNLEGSYKLYAKWSEGIYYNVIFDSLGGTSVSSQQIEEGFVVTEPTVPGKPGYIFAGWYLNDNLYDFNVPVFTDLVLEAKWIEDEKTDLVTGINGASIRINGTQGLRFYASLDESVKNNEHGFYLIYGSITINELKVLVSNNIGLYNDKEIIKTVVPGVKSNNNEFTVVLTGIPIKGYIDKISVVPYVKVNNEIILADDVVIRSVAEVAVNLFSQDEPLKHIIKDINNDLFRSKIEDNQLIFEQTTLYELDPANLKEVFFTDWNSLFNTTFNDPSANDFYQNARLGSTGEGAANTNLKDSNIYEFFNHSLYKDKWGWLLDYLKIFENTYHVAGQVMAIKGDGTYYNENISSKDSLYNANHLIYSIYNFFNKASAQGSYDPIDFTLLGRYDELSNYNDEIIKTDIDIYNYYIKDAIIKLPLIDLMPSPNKTYKYYDGINYYNAFDNFIVNSAILQIVEVDN